MPATCHLPWLAHTARPPARACPRHGPTCPPPIHAHIADLGMIEMYMYARRHGHGYRVINFEGKAVKFGSGRPDRHPAWSRIPLLWALYTGCSNFKFISAPFLTLGSAF